jgi:hypothetical protein
MKTIRNPKRSLTGKSEIRSTNSETISKHKIPMTQPLLEERFEFWIWFIGICCGFQVSCLGFLPR